MTRDDIYRAVLEERILQVSKHGDRSVCKLTRNEQLVVMLEEAGECARAVLDGDATGLKAELVQLAACCFAVLEGL